MTGKEFMNSLAGGKFDIVQASLAILEETKSDYCLIGGLAVNAYVEPVVSLDIDIVVAVDNLEAVRVVAVRDHLMVEGDAHSVKLTGVGSDLRIQVQTDPRYQAFIPRAASREVLGYRMKVAAVEDVLQGKVWAYLDDSRRASKRQKDLADILRLIEAYPALGDRMPQQVKDRLW